MNGRPRAGTVLDGGPTGNGNSLYGADVTDDGKRLWFVGSSGAIGEYDVETGDLENHSAPMDVTNNFNDVSVTGEADEANVYVAGDSGKMYFSFENGATGTWDYTTPGSGSNINAVDFFDDRKGHVVDGNKTVFYTQDGTTWDTFGIADANENFYGVASDGFDDVWVSGGGGILYHWNGSEWTPTDTGDATLRDVEVTDGDTGGLTVGGGGTVCEFDGRDWVQEDTPTGQNLKAVVPGDPLLSRIGERYNRSAAQVALRWLLQQDGVVTIPKASSREHLEANMEVFDFRLTDDEMRAIRRPSKLKTAASFLRSRLGLTG